MIQVEASQANAKLARDGLCYELPSDKHVAMALASALVKILLLCKAFKLAVPTTLSGLPGA